MREKAVFGRRVMLVRAVPLGVFASKCKGQKAEFNQRDYDLGGVPGQYLWTVGV
jgi:hypothetical protein